MSNTPTIIKGYSRHLQKLIATGENLEKELKSLEDQKNSKEDRLAKYHEWFQRVSTQLLQIGQLSVLEEIKSLDATPGTVAVIRGKLRGMYLDIEQGQYNQLIYSVEKKGVEDLLIQADTLMSENGKEAQNYHLAAICIAITLEHAVRKVCEREQIIPESGKWISLGDLLSDLKEKKIISEHMFNRLDNCRKIRNDCVHGKLDSINDSDVRAMMEDVKIFVQDHL